MTIARLLQSTLAALLFGAFGSQLAHADIYTWVDSSGTLNVSNIAPPDGTRVTGVIHASAPETAARDAAAHEAARQAEVQALNERMRQLEGEVQIASRQVPPPDYRPLPASPVVQYFVNAAPQPEQYTVDTTAPAYAGCNPGWIGCSGWWPYPAIVVVGAPNFRPTHPGRAPTVCRAAADASSLWRAAAAAPAVRRAAADVLGVWNAQGLKRVQ